MPLQKQASSLSLALYWLNAESVGFSASISKKSGSSFLVEEEPSETKKVISLSAGNFLHWVTSKIQTAARATAHFGLCVNPFGEDFCKKFGLDPCIGI